MQKYNRSVVPGCCADHSRIADGIARASERGGLSVVGGEHRVVLHDTIFGDDRTYTGPLEDMSKPP